MAFQQTIYKGRSVKITVTLYQSDGTTGVALEATDVVRVKIYKRGQATPSVDIDSVGASANGSVFTIDSISSPANGTLTVAQGDTSNLDPGVYRCEISVVDDSDSDRIKHAESGVIYLVDTGGGDVGLS